MNKDGSKHTQSAAAVFQDFSQNTSLLGIQHFLRNKSFAWLLAYLICVSMSILQSWNVTINFFQQKSYHSIIVVSKTRLPFPSVTVCTGILLREDFNFSSIPGFNVTNYKRLLNNCRDDVSMHEMIHALDDNNIAVKKYMRSLSEERRLELGLNLTHVVKHCRVGRDSCSLSNQSDFYIYSSPHYGNCFTFNPAFNESAAKQLSPIDHLNIILRFPSGGYWLTQRSKPKMGIRIHSPGTVPFLEEPEVTDVFAKEIATISVTLESETVNLKKRSTEIPSCIDSNDETYRRKSIFYREKSPYLYSQEACLKTCIQDSFAKCGAISAFVPVQSEEYERDKRIVFYPDCQLDPIDMETCNCPVPCRKFEYGYLTDYNDIFNIPCETETCHMSSPSKLHGKNKDEFKNEARITIKLRHNIYQKIQEHLSCGLPEYLGILGGNMSLWIGLCIISLLELLELLIKVTTAAIRS